MSTLSPRKKKPVVFISSALSADGHADTSKVFDFFVIVAARLSIDLRHKDYEVILKVPRSQENAAVDQNIFLEELYNVEDLRSSYSGIVIAPFDTDASEKLLAALLRKNQKEGNIPIVTIDKKYKSAEDGKLLNFPGISAPSYVICDAEAGGRLAATSLIKYYVNNQRKHLVILIVTGLEGSQERVEGFNNRIDEHRRSHRQFNPRIVYDNVKWNGGFDRQKTKEKILGNFEEIVALGVNAMFCCNDEMALGIRDALVAKLNTLSAELDLITQKLEEVINRIEIHELRKDSDQASNAVHNEQDKRTKQELEKQMRKLEDQINWIDNNPKIVGFDGIQEMKFYLKNNDKWILNTVDVQVHEQVSSLTNWFVHPEGIYRHKVEPKLAKEI